MPNVFMVFHYYISTMSSYKGESKTSKSEHSHGNKASCDEETYGDSHSGENSVEKNKSNLEKLIFVDNKCKL